MFYVLDVAQVPKPRQLSMYGVGVGSKAYSTTPELHIPDVHERLTTTFIAAKRDEI